jgi:beta-xylosidase
MSGTRPCLRVALLLIGLLFVFSAEAKQDKTDGDERLTFTFDLTNRSKKIKNTFSDINLWEFQSGWLKNANSYPDDYFKKNYPFVNNIQFMTATGGVASRDLFINPTDTTIKNDYKFDELIAAVRGVVKKGLKPMIKTGNVPIKFSTSPKLGVFGVNTRPPDDYNLYYDYIKALATALVREFGINEVKTWSWGVLTEYENKDWFWVKDEDPAASKIYYFKLYDYTVAALEDVIGPENLKVGAHSMTWNLSIMLPKE